MFCKNCAEVLTDTDVTCPRCGFAAGTGTKYCGNCGTLVAPGAVVCEICGADVSSMTFAQGAQQVQQQASPQFAQAQQPQAPYGQPQAPYGQPQAPYGQPQAPYGQPQVPYGQPSTNVYVNVAQAGPGISPKSRVAAGLLGIFLGSLGVHNFYLGYTGKGVAQLLITLLSCGFGAVITEIWGFIEGIMILTGGIHVDGIGRELKN